MAAVAENWVRRAPGGVDRIEACFTGAAFAPHRHDTYAIGVTLAGVQSFDYRGEARHSLPGQLIVLHPDELHDGRAGDGAAFRYRTAYIRPADIQEVLGGRTLPFIAGGLSSDPGLAEAVEALLADYDRPLTLLEYQDALAGIAAALEAACGGGSVIRRANREAARAARDYIEACLDETFSLADLERATGHDRWQLSRDFRAMFGASPYRYLILRRLEKARGLLLDGRSGAQAAADCGFADQSHFGRLFRKTWGLTPNAWLKAMQPAHDRSSRAAGRRPIQAA
ncbi:MAG: AraC family transcriptional regulator [Caulobacter sp.]|nr:AraC family transcriptional regulator [Caulobacter sp.]